ALFPSCGTGSTRFLLYLVWNRFHKSQYRFWNRFHLQLWNRLHLDNRRRHRFRLHRDGWLFGTSSSRANSSPFAGRCTDETLFDAMENITIPEASSKNASNAATRLTPSSNIFSSSLADFVDSPSSFATRLD